jgi:hypothetical protein
MTVQRSAALTASRRTVTVEAICLLLVILVGGVIVGLHVRDDHRLSPIDELQHVDYMVKAGALHIPRKGERDGPIARHEAACRGIEAPYRPPPCAGAESAPDSAFPENADDTASFDPPLYYVTSGLAARAVHAALHLDSYVTAGRLVGIAWLAVTMVALWFLLIEMCVGLLARTAVGLLLVSTPLAVHTYSTVTSDAALLLAGAAALLVVLRWERRVWPAWPVVAIASLCALTKVSALLAVGVAVVYLLVRAVHADGKGQGTRPRWQLLAMAAAAAAVTVVTWVVWLWIVDKRAVPGAPIAPSAAVFHATRLGLDKVAAQVGAFLSPLTAPPILAPLVSVFTDSILTVLNALVIAGTFGGAALGGARSRLEALGTSTAALMLVGGPAYVVAIYVSDHQVLPGLPHRYGMALLPAAMACLGALLVKVWMRWAVALFATVAVLYTIGHLATR